MAIDKTTFPAIRADVSVEHHPDCVASKWEGLDVDGTSGQHTLLAGVAAARAVYTGQAEAIEVRKTLAQHVQGRPVMTASGPALRHGLEGEHAASVDRVRAKVLRTLDAYTSQIAATADNLTQKVAAKLRDGATPAPLQQEIRAHVRGLAERERLQFINKQPLQTNAAVASAPPYLSGLTDQTMDLATQHAEQRSEVEVRQQRAVCEMLGHLATARDRFNTWADKEVKEASTPAARAASKVKALGR